MVLEGDLEEGGRWPMADGTRRRLQLSFSFFGLYSEQCYGTALRNDIAEIFMME
jgi:hypothetical protein